MGTNFYYELNENDETHVYHIGKASFGWQFMFHKSELFPDAGTLWLVLKMTAGIIRDEYGDEWDIDKFQSFIYSKRNCKRDPHCENFDSAGKTQCRRGEFC